MKEEEVVEVIIVVITTPMVVIILWGGGGMEIQAIIPTQGHNTTQDHNAINLSHKGFKVSPNPTSQLVKSMARMVIYQLIAIIEWTLHTKASMPLLNQLQWWLIPLKCKTVMASSQILDTQIMLLLTCHSYHCISNQLQAMKQSLQGMVKGFQSLIQVMVSFKH